MARIKVNCGCEDAPCCGCDEVMLTGEDALEAIRDDEAYDYDEPFESFDLSDDGDALASAGHGMDEDYFCDDMQCEGYDEH